MSFMRRFMTVRISGSSSFWTASVKSFFAMQWLFSPKSLANLLERFSSIRKYLGSTQTKFMG